MIVTEQLLDAMKRDLARFLPHIKPTDRVESIARGFGFARYVNLLQVARSPQGLERTFSPETAARYCDADIEVFKNLGR